MNYDSIEFVPVTFEDVEALTVIMKRAFDEDTRIHLGEEAGGPPGYDNGDFIRKWYLNSGSDSYKIIYGGELIGGFSVFINGRNNYLGNIFVNPNFENKGIGTLIWKLIENKYPEADKWSTDTPGFSKRNHNFYINKCGFKVVRIENPMDPMEESYIMEKEIKHDID